VKLMMKFTLKNKLFQRQKMQPLKLKDIPKVAIIVGVIIGPPLIFGLFI